MLRDDPLLRTLLRTRLAPPRRQPRLLPRPALTARLCESLDHRLTLVQAGTGYGKSTALADLADSLGPQAFWYSAAEADAEPPRFLADLIGAFQLRLPTLSDWPQAALQEVSQSGHGAWAQVVDALVNALAEALSAPSLLIVDDYHFVAASPEVSALVEGFIATCRRRCTCCSPRGCHTTARPSLPGACAASCWKLRAKRWPSPPPRSRRSFTKRTTCN